MMPESIPSAPRIRGVIETCLYVDDLDAAAEFYESVLGLELESRQEGRHVFFYCGDQMLLLFDPKASDSPDAIMPRHGARGQGHVALRVAPQAIDSWIKRLEAAGVEIEKLLGWPRSDYRSIYFRDPSGNSLELTTGAIWGFPPEEPE